MNFIRRKTNIPIFLGDNYYLINFMNFVQQRENLLLNVENRVYLKHFKTLYTHLLNVPLFILLIDQINTSNTNTSHFIGSCNVKLNELIEILNQSIQKNGTDIPLVEQQTFCCTLFNLMGTKIGTCDIAVRFCHYGTTFLTQLFVLDEESMKKTEKKVPAIVKQPIVESVVPSQTTSDTIVKHIHFVNEKKDVGLQLSRSDLPLSSLSNNHKSIQTRWTSTKTRTHHDHQLKSHYLRTIEDPSLDDPTISFYQPPALYFNSDSDFLHMKTPSTTKMISQAKENRLSYIASIPIANFDDREAIVEDNDENKKHQPMRRKTMNNVRFNLPSSSPSDTVCQTKLTAKPQILAKDFLHQFPLLRSLVEEALALQKKYSHCNLPTSIEPILVNKRPQSAVEKRQKQLKQTIIRPKSVIIPRNINNARRFHSPASKTNQIVVTKGRLLVTII
ncbi:hypothetical protein I4U23_026610 [Adineta vaga]|nr:hypothetical protein I4U23_026610 [Adineta vaga]